MKNFTILFHLVRPLTPEHLDLYVKWVHHAQTKNIQNVKFWGLISPILKLVDIIEQLE